MDDAPARGRNPAQRDEGDHGAYDGDVARNERCVPQQSLPLAQPSLRHPLVARRLSDGSKRQAVQHLRRRPHALGELPPPLRFTKPLLRLLLLLLLLVWQPEFVCLEAA